MPKMPSMEPATSARALCWTASEVVHHPDCGPIFCQYFLLVQFILCRDIQPVALKVCIGLKPGMHLKDDVRPLIPVATETQVDLQNRPEDQVLARQNTSGHKSGMLSPQDSGWVRPTNLRIKISLETVLHLKFSALDRQCSSPRDTGQVATPGQGIDVPL